MRHTHINFTICVPFDFLKNLIFILWKKIDIADGMKNLILFGKSIIDNSSYAILSILHFIMLHIRD